MKKENSRTKLEKEIYAEQEVFASKIEAQKEELKNKFCKSNPVWTEKFKRIHAEDYMWKKKVSTCDFQILNKPSDFIALNYAYRHTKSRFYNISIDVEPYYDYEGCCYPCSLYLKNTDAEAFKKEQKKAKQKMKKINELLESLHDSTEYKKYLKAFNTLEEELYNGEKSIREKKEKEYNQLFAIKHDFDDFTKEEFMEELKKHFSAFYIERESHYRSDMVRYMFHKITGVTTHSRAVAFTFKTTENCDTHYSREFLNKIIEQIESEMNNRNSPANIIERLTVKYPTVYFHQKKTEVSAYMNVDEHHYNSNYGHIGTMSYKKINESDFESIITKGIERVKNNAEKYSKMKNLNGYDKIRQIVYGHFAKLNGWNF